MAEGLVQGRDRLYMGITPSGFLSKARQVCDGFGRLSGA
jgi:hypothetical protein